MLYFAMLLMTYLKQSLEVKMKKLLLLLLIGLVGCTGDKGEQGIPGPQGPVGIQGVVGETGPRGYKGEKGDNDTTWVMVIPPPLYIVEYDSLLECEQRIISKGAYLFKWKHTFTDTLSRFETLIKFEVGADLYLTRDDILNWKPYDSIWSGMYYAPTTLTEYINGRDEWQFVISGIPFGYYAIPAVRAVDGSGNESKWYYSVDSTLVDIPFYLLHL